MYDYQNLDIQNIDSEERWVKIEESQNYMLSCYGRVKLLRPFNGDYIRIQDVSHGYAYIPISTNNKSKKYRINRLVAKYFVDNPDNKPYVNHKDGNKLNNRYTNLEWSTASENMYHAYGLGLKKPTRK